MHKRIHIEIVVVLQLVVMVVVAGFSMSVVRELDIGNGVEIVCSLEFKIYLILIKIYVFRVCFIFNPEDLNVKNF